MPKIVTLQIPGERADSLIWPIAQELENGDATIHEVADNTRFLVSYRNRNRFGSTSWRVILARINSGGTSVSGVNSKCTVLVNISGITRAKAALKYAKCAGITEDSVHSDRDIVAMFEWLHAAPNATLLSYLKS